VQARKALEAAQTVISLTAYRSPELMDLADCLLPVSTFAETAGTFVNCEGRAQSFNGVVPAPGEARPAWKVLRVLANSLELPGFEYESSEAVRNEVGAKASALDNAIAAGVPVPALGSSSFDAADCFERIADVPIYSADPIVRRAPSLQRTGDAASPVVRINPASMAALGFAQGQRVRVTQSGGEAILELAADASVAEGVARIAAACEATATLPAMVGTVRLAKA
jgi:NADH-quinone oxidoreductase subunit G